MTTADATVSTACAQYGAGGQCLAFGTSPAANPPPGGAAQTTALCLEYNAVGQCNRRHDDQCEKRQPRSSGFHVNVPAFR